LSKFCILRESATPIEAVSDNKYLALGLRPLPGDCKFIGSQASLKNKRLLMIYMKFLNIAI